MMGSQQKTLRQRADTDFVTVPDAFGQAVLELKVGMGEFFSGDAGGDHYFLYAIRMNTGESFADYYT